MLRTEVGKWRKIKLTKIKIYFLNINALKLKLKTRMWQEKLTMYLQCLFKSSFGTSCIKAINWYCRSYKYTLTDGVRTRHRPPPTPTSWGPLECNDPIGPLTHVTKLALSIGRLERAMPKYGLVHLGKNRLWIWILIVRVSWKPKCAYKSGSALVLWPGHLAQAPEGSRWRVSLVNFLLLCCCRCWLRRKKDA